MAHPNLDTIDRFCEAYGRHGLVAIRQVMAEEVTWSFPGSHPASGTQAGIDAVIAFFNTMGGIMGESNVEAVKRVTGANDGYVVECQHIRTHRKDGFEVDHPWCVLWHIADGKIVEGRHCARNPQTVDEFFSRRLS
ncbi:MAG: nuclear transport factor 2 family protein [Chloroflexi bacterium]|nr:nuclear transport factor 2 family protein [Chloroflexota bacterium]